MTLSRLFTKLLADSGLNMAQVARRAKIDPTTPWKIKHGKPIRHTTLAKVLRAMRYSFADQDYKEAFALWGAEVVGAAHQSMEAGVTRVRTKGTAADKLTAEFGRALGSIPQDLWPLLSRALAKPESLVLWLKSNEALKR